MLVHQGNARSIKVDRRLSLSLAAVAGALNAAGFYAVGLYASNMTGNVSALAQHVALGEPALAGLFLAVVASFTSGAAACTVLVNAGRQHSLRGIYALGILVEAALLAVMGLAELWLPALQRGLGATLCLAFVLGLQNAIVTRISDARLRTTHVTGMLTDLGIELANLLDPQFRGDGAQAGVNRDKLSLHALTVLAFLSGGIVGVAVYRMTGAFLLFGASGLLATLALPGAWSTLSPAARQALPPPSGGDQVPARDR